jgi:DNA-binding XRE family transcriptional regulator
MTQDKLAHEAGLSLRTVQRIEPGGRRRWKP